MSQWTNEHHKIVTYHLENGIPHPDTHDKPDFMQWAKEAVGNTLHTTSWASMVGAVAAVCFHIGHPKEDAKKIALEASGFLTDIYAFSAFASNLWDHHVLHNEARTNPTLNATRQLLVATQRQLRR